MFAKITIKYIKSEDQVADILTKSLGRVNLEKMRDDSVCKFFLRNERLNSRFPHVTREGVKICWGSFGRYRQKGVYIFVYNYY